MSRRKLWLGDWQRGSADPTSAGDDDTVTFLPDDEPEPEAAPPPAEERPGRNRTFTLAAALAGLLLLAVLLATNGSGGNTSTRTSAQDRIGQQFQPVPQAPPAQTVPPGGFGGADLTGAEAAKAARAALSRFPGSIERVTAGPGGGGYIVHVFQDGYEVHVVVSDKFKVLGSDAGGGANVLPSAPAQPGNSS